MSRTGGCLCGAVRYQISSDPKEMGACHCEMCRRWSGGIYMAVKAPEADVTITGADNLGTYTSSDWAERCFCKICGSSVFYRVTIDGPYKGHHHFAAGSLDSHDGLEFSEQMFIDLKPDCYSFSQKTRDLDTAQIMAMFADVTPNT